MSAYHAPETVDCTRGTTGTGAEVEETTADGKGPLAATVVVVVLLDTRDCGAESARSSLTMARTIFSSCSSPNSATCVEAATLVEVVTVAVPVDGAEELLLVA